MAYTYHGTSNLIALPNRTVQTYPSGLVRVERSFVCRKDRVAKFRNTIRVNELMPFDNGAPAFDGLYIFPEPQEIVRDDGFVEFRVTAYGRTNTEGSYAVNKIPSAVNFQIFERAVVDDPLTIATVQKPILANSYIVRLVFIENEQIDILSIREKYGAAIFDQSGIPFTKTTVFEVFPFLNSSIYNPQENKTVDIIATLQLASFESSGFGKFQETTMIFNSVSTQSLYSLGIWTRA
jgi:hypothetical protein